ncbi:hypothetical protein TNCT_605011 [Trichonephila clavata]|uniref:Uncharacterized protein n=1 Tax=Trichonephila clavata TaxID=2740835 RepID=A0A8X6GKH0_TRICU|nr:hypothetical protein TNCT_605011 [Trichonephila clavata]
MLIIDKHNAPKMHWQGSSCLFYYQTSITGSASKRNLLKRTLSNSSLNFLNGLNRKYSLDTVPHVWTMRTERRKEKKKQLRRSKTQFNQSSKA